MADEVDLANRHVQMELDIALAQLANAPDPTPKSDYCLNCGEHVHATFCDADCRDDYERRRYTHSQRYTEH